MIYLRIIIMLLTFVTIPFMAGIASKIIFGSNRMKTSFVRTYTDGFVLWLAVYQLLEVPMVLMGASLSLLSIMWIIITIVLIMISLIFGKSQYKALFKDVKESFTNWSSYKITAFVMMTIVFVIAVFFENGSVTDDAFYLGAATDAASSNKLWRYETYTGREAVGWELKKYAFTGYPMLIATLSRFFNLTAATVAHIGICIWSVIMTYIVYYLLSSVIFKEKWQRWGIICIMCALMIAGNYNTESSATFFMTGAWLGKSWLPNVCMPLMLYYAVLAMDNLGSKLLMQNRAMIVLCSVTSLFFSSMSVILVPILIGIICVYYSIKNRTLKNILPAVIAIITPIIIGVLYIVM
ncbi:MAG: DUF6077 domain-containing protein [Clostridia bacterium]|nr:DUF6077 domain-containing protein [Clostridia bacterium]